MTLEVSTHGYKGILIPLVSLLLHNLRPLFNHQSIFQMSWKFREMTWTGVSETSAKHFTSA